MRSAKSQHGDMFSVEMQGIVYETGDNYDIAKSLKNGFSSVPQFAHPSIWKSQSYKRRYGKFRLQPSEVK